MKKTIIYFFLIIILTNNSYAQKVFIGEGSASSTFKTSLFKKIIDKEKIEKDICDLAKKNAINNALIDFDIDINNINLSSVKIIDKYIHKVSRNVLNCFIEVEFLLEENFNYEKKEKKTPKHTKDTKSFCAYRQPGGSYLVALLSEGAVCNQVLIDKNYINKEFYEYLSKRYSPGEGLIVLKELKIPKSTIIVEKKEPDNKSNDQANLEEEKRKIEEEKKKIEEEKQRIAEAKKKQEEEEEGKERNSELFIIGSGTGFFVSAEGHVVSNDHVVGICKKVASKIDGEIKYFNVIKTDEVNDLGIIKGEYKNPTYLSIKSDGAEYGEDIVAFGYPLSDDLSDSVKLTRGIVSSLSGPGNNYSEIQIDAAIQPGNSGGPVLNMDGQVVGVASSGLNKIAKLLDEDSPYIPENINFAVAAPTLSNFLKANGVKIDNKKFKVNNTKELARIGRPATLQLFCINTKAVFEDLKATKKHSDVLFEKVIDLK